MCSTWKRTFKYSHTLCVHVPDKKAMDTRGLETRMCFLRCHAGGVGREDHGEDV